MTAARFLFRQGKGSAPDFIDQSFPIYGSRKSCVVSFYFFPILLLCMYKLSKVTPPIFAHSLFFRRQLLFVKRFRRCCCLLLSFRSHAEQTRGRTRDERGSERENNSTLVTCKAYFWFIFSTTTYFFLSFMPFPLSLSLFPPRTSASPISELPFRFGNESSWSVTASPLVSATAASTALRAIPRPPLSGSVQSAALSISS